MKLYIKKTKVQVLTKNQLRKIKGGTGDTQANTSDFILEDIDAM